MFDRLRIVPALQLTRMAMVFTAIADGLCALFLQAQHTRLAVNPAASIEHFIQPDLIAAMILISIGLYGYGMALNDVIDHRRDRQLAADRPLPSGRISLFAAHVICVALAILALGGGAYFAASYGWKSLLLVACCGTLITFFDLAAKYLVVPGLLTLGLIRFFHALIAAPDMPVPWQPLLLFNHVALLAALRYAWSDKRPAFTRGHLGGMIASLLSFNIACVALLWWRRGGNGLALQWGLCLPAASALVFISAILWLLRHKPASRQSADALVRAGLLWLILDDAAFTAVYVNGRLALLLLSLLPVAWLSHHALRLLSNLLSLTRPPQFKRAQG